MDCGRLNPEGWVTVDYHIYSDGYSYGYTVYAYYDTSNKLERLGGRIYAPPTTWSNMLCMHLVRPIEEIINYDYIVVKIYKRVLRKRMHKIKIYKTDKENKKLIYIPASAKELYDRVKALLGL